MEALKKRLEQRDPSFKISNMKYKSKYGYYKCSGIEYPFFFEIAVVHCSKIPYNLEYIESLNSSVMPGRYSFLVGSDNETFQWQTPADRKNNNIHQARSILSNIRVLPAIPILKEAAVSSSNRLDNNL